MIIAAYDKAAFPEPFTILGQRLRPFSLGHYIILRRLKSPFVDDISASASMGDLICGRSAKDAETLLQNLDEMEPLAQRLGEVNTVDLIKDNVAEIQMFNDYIIQGSAMPGYFQHNVAAQSAPLRQHWSQNVMLSLVSNCGYTRQEAMECPLSQAFFDHLAYLEKEGVIQLMSEAEFKMMNEPEAEAVNG
jgi:hypothetical protein